MLISCVFFFLFFAFQLSEDELRDAVLLVFANKQVGQRNNKYILKGRKKE